MVKPTKGKNGRLNNVSANARLNLTIFGQFPDNTRLILFATFFAGLAGGINEVNFTYYLLSMGFKEIFVATLASLGALTAAFVSIPLGLLVDRIGRKRSIAIAQSLALPMFLLQVFLPLSPIILTASVIATMAGTIHGLSEGPLLVESTEDTKRVTILSMVTMSNLAAVIIGNFLGGKITALASFFFHIPLESMWAYRTSFICATIISIISISFYLRLKPVPISATKRIETKNPLKKLFSNVESPGFIWRLLVGQLLIGFGAGFTVPLFALYFRKVFNATADQWGTIVSIAKFPMFFGVYISPKVARKFGSLRTVLACQYISIPFLLMTLFAPNIAIAGIGFGIRHALMNMTGPIWSGFYMSILKPCELSTASSFLTVVWNIANSTGTRIGGGMLEAGYHAYNFYITAATYLTASTFYFFSFRKYEPWPFKRKIVQQISSDEND